MEAAFIIVSLVVAFAVILMWDLHRNQTCRWCDHCRREENDRRERRRVESHERYHRFHHIPLSNCHDPDCPGR